MRASTVLLAAVAMSASGCAAVTAPEPPLTRGVAARPSVVIVADSTLAGEAAATARLALDATLELARGDDMATGVLAATSEGARVVLPLGDPGPAPIGRNAETEAALPALTGKSCRKGLDALVIAQASRGSLVVLLAAPPSGEDARELERVTRDASQRGYRILRAPVEAGARAAVALVAEDGFDFLVAKGAAASVSPRGGRVAAIGLAPLSVKEWRDPPAEKLALPAGTDLLLYRPAWTLELEKDAPPPIAFVGDGVPIVLAVKGRSALGLPVSVAARSMGRTVVLARTATRDGLRFESEADAPREEGPCEVTFDLDFSAGEARFSQERVFRYLAKRRTGTPPPTVKVTPGRLDVGPVWSDSRAEVKLRVQGDPDRPVKVTVESPFAAASELALEAGEEREVAVTVDPRRLSGGERLRLRAEVSLVSAARVRPLAKGGRAAPEAAPEAAPPRLLSVPVTCEARSLRAPASFDLGSVRGGETVSRAFALEGARVTARVLADEDLGAAVALEGDKLVLRASPKAGLAAGPRSGKVELALPGSSSPPLVRAFTLDVTEPPRALALSVSPDTLRLQARYGWTEARFKVSTTVAARLDAQPGALVATGARIGVRRDIRLRAADPSWDARTLAPGEERELVLRVYLGSDLPAGRYEGTIALDARGPGESASKPLPVTVEVER